MKALVERMILGKIREHRPAPLDHRDRQKFGQLDQRGVRCRIAPRQFGDDRRPFAGDEHFGDGLDVGRRRRSFRRRWRIAQLGWRLPGLAHGFDGKAHIDRAGGGALRHLAGANHLLEHGRYAARLIGPFDDRLDQPVRAADHAQQRLPLCSRVELRIVAEAERLAGDHEHRNSLAHRSVDTHRSLQQAHAGMQHHRLHAPGNRGVTGGEIDRQRLVRAAQIGRAGRVGELLPAQRFPHRAPLRPRRRHDIVDIQAAKCLHNRFTAIKLVFHRSTSFLPSVPLQRPQNLAYNGSLHLKKLWPEPPDIE